jgi:hypothetical protein
VCVTQGTVCTVRENCLLRDRADGRPAFFRYKKTLNKNNGFEDAGRLQL